MDAAKAAERARILAMTPLQRAALALELGEQLEQLRKAQARVSEDMSERRRRTFAIAETLAAWIAEEGARSAVIGAVALAVHGYVRATDLDLATELDPMMLRALATRAKGQGWSVALELPDRDDPLGGVLTITGDDFDAVQVVNFHNPFAATKNPAREALIAATPLSGFELAVVGVEDLVLLKLYAGGLSSWVDIRELLAVHPELDLASLRARAARYGLVGELERVLAFA